MNLQKYLNQKALEYLPLIYNEYGKYFNQEQKQLFQQLIQSKLIVVEENDIAYQQRNKEAMDQLAHGGRVFEDNKIHFYPFNLKDQSIDNIKNSCEQILIHELLHFFIRPEYIEASDELKDINHDVTEGLVDMCARDIMSKYQLYPNYNSNYFNNVIFIREALQNIANIDEKMSLVFNGSIEDMMDKTSINGYNSLNEYMNTKNGTTPFNQAIKDIVASNFPEHKESAERKILNIAANCKTKEGALLTIKGLMSDKLAENIIHNYYDDVSLAHEYLDTINYYYQQLSQSGMDINSLISEYNPSKGMYPLETKLSQNQVIELSIDFFKDINPEFANYFISDITNNKKNIFFSNNPRATIKNDGSEHKLEVTNFGDLRDLYTVAHEYTHLFDSTNGLNETRKIISETNAQCMERCLDSFLLSMSDDKLAKYQIDRNQLEQDITNRNIATFFNRYDNIRNVNNQRSTIRDSEYMLSQVYSTHFETLGYDSQKISINNMISETRNNNLPKVISNIPCDLSKNNPSRNEVVNQSVESTVQRVTEKKLQTQKRQSDVDVKRLIKKPANTQVSTPTSSPSNNGYINTLILTLITGFAMGIVSVLAYIFISR